MSFLVYDFIPPNSEGDFNFVQKCLNVRDFILNISEEIDTHSDMLIIRHNKKSYIGIFIPSIHIISDMKHSRPIIYLLKAYRIHSSISLCKIVKYLFENEEVDRIFIQVFSHNTMMLNCMKNLGIAYRGSIDDIRKIESNSFVSINFYDIDYKKYQELESDFSD